MVMLTEKVSRDFCCNGRKSERYNRDNERDQREWKKGKSVMYG